jgi:D-cysteine desulfhydrase
MSPSIELTVPTPVRLLTGVGQRARLWLKDDSRLHPAYGGNKCRKLVHLLFDAERRGARRILTFGTAGSHHVLATGLLAGNRGLQVTAFLAPQPWSMHAQQVLMASVDAGIDLVPVASLFDTVCAARKLTDRSAVYFPPGGSNALGAIGYLQAAIELKEQIGRGELPEPDYIVVALGTAGTAAGLAAGVEMAGLQSIVVGVSILRAPGHEAWARRLAKATLRAFGSKIAMRSNRLIADYRWLGGGYGCESEAGNRARDVGSGLDLPLDPSYTAKAFAGALALVNCSESGQHIDTFEAMLPKRPNNVLYWHTLGEQPHVSPATHAATLSAPLRALLRQESLS